MTNVTLERLNTLTVTANEIYALILGSAGYVNLHNDTTGTLYISDSDDMDAADCIFVDSGSGYSNLAISGTIYIKSMAAGSVQVVARG